MKKITTRIKFYLLLLICFLSLNPIESLAQIPQFFNNNTSTPSNSFPWSTVAGKGIQSYFAPNQFLGAYNGNIMRAFWKVTPNVTTTYTSLTIKMGQTTNAALDLGVIHSSTPLTTVYFAASVTLTSDANGWVNIVLQTPFIYNPAQALIVDVFNCSASNTGMIQCNYAAGGPSPVRTYTNNSGCSMVYSGQDNNTACFGIDLQPLTPCGATVTAGTTNGLANPCIGTSNIYNLLGATLGTGLTYQWLTSPTGNAPWTPIPLATNQTYTMLAPVSPLYLRCRVACTSTLAFDTSSALFINILPWSPTSNCYCGNSNATIASFNDIGQFSFGNLINPLVTPSPQLNNITAVNGYTNFMNLTPQFYIKGQNYPVGIYAISSSASFQTSYAKVFIDFNHNAVFTDPGEEVFGDNINAVNLYNANGIINIPLTALPGVTRLRVVQWNTTLPAAVLPCGTYNYGETEDYLVNIVNQSINNPATTQVTIPAGNCFTNNETIFATVRNFGSNTINLNATNNIQAKLNVTGPLGTTSYTTTLSSGSLFANGVNSLTAIFNGVDMYAGGNYIINMDTFIVGGTLINGYNVDDTLYTPILVSNSRPTPGPSFTVCQNSFIPFGQGLSVSGCTTPILDSITYTFLPSQLVFGAQPCFPSSASMPGACWLSYVPLTAGNILPPGATILSAEQKLTNLATSNGGLASQARFPLFYGNTPIVTNAFTPSAQGSALGASANFTWTNSVSNPVVSNIFTTLGVGDSIKMAYNSISATNATNNGFVLNAGGNPTEMTLKVIFTYVPAAYEWYNVPTGGTSFYSFTPMNPIGIAGSGLNTTANPGTFTFYASCIGSSACRAQSDLIITPSPTVIQDTLVACESLFSSNVASFDLTQLNNSVSNNNPFATVEYYGDAGLFSNLIPYSNYPSSNTVIYSKVIQGSCFASDSVVLQVNSLPNIGSNILTGNACAPSSVDVLNLISPFATIPAGSTYSYFDDNLYSNPHPNPNNITMLDTVYLVVSTNTVPSCKDSAVAYVNVIPANNFIVNQDITFPPFYFSNPTLGPVCQTKTFIDGQADTVRSTLDCRKAIMLTDVLDATSLGMVTVCQDISPTILSYNGQPYANRVYEITAANPDSAIVCLHYLDDDMVQFNSVAATNNWPLLPTAANPALVNNIAITKVQNGPVGNIGATATTIPSALISASYNAATQVWTICFPVSGFSHFYLHSKNSYNAPLPVTLVDFNVVRKGQESELSWGTMQEENNSHFIVERSADGKTFMSISNAIYSKAPQGNSNVRLDYNFTDTKPFSGINYYRLRQYDIDGKESISEVKEVYFGTDATVTVYPNPVQDNLIVEVNTDKTSNADIKVFDASGRVVKTISSKLAEGNNKIEIGMSELASGTYLIELVSGKNLKITKVITKK